MNKKEKREAAKEIAASKTLENAGVEAHIEGVETGANNSETGDTNTGTKEGEPAKGKVIDIKDISIDIKLGRPVDPTSDRQKRLAEYEQKKAVEGQLHRGRPKDPTSANAQKTALREQRVLEAKLMAAKELEANGTIVAGIEQLEEMVKAGKEMTAEIETTN